MKQIAVFPGSFDPITKGHEDVVRRVLPLFDEMIIAIGINSAKSYMFTIDQRIHFITNTFKNEPKVRIDTYNGLTVDYCKKMGAKIILRGVRNSSDFEFEQSIAQMNRAMAPEIETIFIATAPEYSAISSTIVREIVRNNGDASQFVPKGIKLK